MLPGETIVALATPSGESAIGIVRLSGDACPSLAASVFQLPSPSPRVAHLADYLDLHGEVLDQVLFIFYAQGASYTSEPSLEIFCHGNPLLLRKVIDDLLARGCRLAEPGEFTRLAFTSGNMELVQAEAVATLIKARSEHALKVASKHLSGETGRCVNQLRDQILSVMAQIEAYVDFPQEDLPPENLSESIAQLQAIVTVTSSAAETGKYAHLLETGVRTLIAGVPNAGKSSLLNALCGKSRSIVSDQPGTTRDYVSERIHLGQFEIELIDTAGLRNEATGIERMGMDKTLELAERMDFFLLVLDATAPSPSLPSDFIKGLGSGNCILVENKIDLTETKNHQDVLPEVPHAAVSALTGEGMDSLKSTWERILEKTLPSPTSAPLVVNARHSERLCVAKDALHNAIRLLNEDKAVDLALSEIRLAIDAVGEITGGVDNEDMLDQLFQSFCIGK